MNKHMKQLVSLFIILAMLVASLAVLASCEDEKTPGILDDPKGETTTEGTEEVTEPPKYTLTLSADKTAVLRGETVQLASVFVADNGSTLETEEPVYNIVAGSEYASIEGNILTVLATAPHGATITVQAVEGASYSNTVTLTVSVPAESVTISAKNNLKAPIPGQMIILEAVVTPAGAPSTIEWQIIEGKDHAKIENSVLAISENAPVGTTIKVKALCGTLESNELTFTVRSATEDIDIESVTLSAPVSNVLPGASVVITGVYAPANATNSYYLDFDSGKEYATIHGNVLVINSDAPAGAVIKVKAVAGTASSNLLTFTVIDTDVDITKIEIEANTLTPIQGKTVIFSSKITPTDATEKITYKVTVGGDHAHFEGNILFIDDDAPEGATVKVVAVCECEEITSNEVTITVKPAVEKVDITEIIISATTNQVLKNSNYVLTKIVKPENTTETATWHATAGAEYVTFNGDTMQVGNAPTGTVIKIVSACGDVISNELTFTVAASRDEILASTYDIDIEQTSFVTDKNGMALPVLSVEVVNMLGETVTGKTVSFNLLGDGSQFVKLNKNGLACSFEAVGHGSATVEVSIDGTDVKKIVTVNAIVPPTSIALPEIFAERLDIKYAFSMVDPTTNAAEKLPFAGSPKGTGIFCKDLTYSFTHKDGSTGDEVAVYENGHIVFKKEGEVTVTVSSASGSRIEASTSYTFNVNKGYNVSTFAELNGLVRYADVYDGTTPVNFVVLEKPVGYDPNYNYGYALVPPSALLPLEQQTLQEIFSGAKNRIQVVNNSGYINGNNHPIDGSQMRIFSESELRKYLEDTGKGVTEDNINTYLTLHALFSFEPWDSSGFVDFDKDYTIKLYNLIVKGNAPFEYDPTDYNDLKDSTSLTADDAFIGAYRVGISIGGPALQYNVHYSIDSQGLTASGFNQCIAISNVAEGHIKDLYAYNCYSTGIIAKHSIVTLENIKLGLCGATGIELSPDDHKQSGFNNDQLQAITFKGTINAAGAGHDLNSTYFENYKLDANGTTIKMLVDGNMQMYEQDPTKTPHIKNAEGKFAIVTLLFHDQNEIVADYMDNMQIDGTYKNASKVSYSSDLGGGIINLADIPAGETDTEHQYIRVPIYAPVALPTGTVQLEVGVVLFYNWNYNAN